MMRLLQNNDLVGLSVLHFYHDGSPPGALAGVENAPRVHLFFGVGVPGSKVIPSVFG